MSMTRLGKIKLRAFAWIVAIPLAAWGAISLAPAWLTLPVIGAAAWAIVLAVGGSARAIAQPICWTCSRDLADQPATDYGVACPDCGGFNAFGAIDHFAALPPGESDDEEGDNRPA